MQILIFFRTWLQADTGDFEALRETIVSEMIDSSK